jgi:hypothetical protein
LPEVALKESVYDVKESLSSPKEVFNQNSVVSQKAILLFSLPRQAAVRWLPMRQDSIGAAMLNALVAEIPHYWQALPSGLCGTTRLPPGVRDVAID